MDNKASIKEIRACHSGDVPAINNTLNVLTGKWKLPITDTFLYNRKRLVEIQNNIPGMISGTLS